MVSVTAFFAGISAFFYIWLSVNVIRRRRVLKLPIGDAGDRIIQLFIRAHANFAEYAPFTLILMAINELSGRPKWLLFLIGLAFLAARATHAYGLIACETRNATDVRFRRLGMQATLGVLGILAILAIV